MKKVLIIGCGNLIRALLLAQKRSSVKSTFSYTLVNRTIQKSQDLANQLTFSSIEVLTSKELEAFEQDHLRAFDVIILGIKPMQLKELLLSTPQLRSFEKEIISTLAGVPSKMLQELFPKAKRWTRLMPSIVVESAASTSLYLTHKSADQREASLVPSWYTHEVGSLLEVKTDQLLDELTLIFGSNAAFIAALITPWITYLENKLEGTSTILNSLAKDLMLTQWMAAAHYLSNKELTETIKRVKTPGGITAEALISLDKDGYFEIIQKSLDASTKRAQEVAKLVSHDLKSSNLLQ